MSKNNHDDNIKEEPIHDVADNAAEIEDILAENDGEEAAGEAEAMAAYADLQAQLEEARAAIEKEKKDYLFLMADFDNYRKRAVREKADLIKNASENVLKGLLPIVDDFERGLVAAQGSEDAAAIKEGMELIYNKLIKFLQSNGVKAMESTGADFDPDFHEAIATIPAPSEDLKGKVVDTTQKGYMINDKVLRHAKVAVGE